MFVDIIASITQVEGETKEYTQSTTEGIFLITKFNYVSVL